MFVLGGRLLVTAHDLETDRPVEERSVGADDFVFSPAMEAHSIRNLSDTEEAAFLCCIGNAVEK